VVPYRWKKYFSLLLQLTEWSVSEDG
jgi:hypothetical protein